MGKIILKAVLFFAKLLIKQGVDFERLKIIAETKLLMDRRRVYMNWRQRQQKENSNPLLITLIVYTVFGLFIGAMVFTVESIIISMIIIHSYILFMMAMTMITDFSSVLLDTADNQIILPRPVNSRTLFTARLIHILVYLLQFSIALALFPVIFIFIKFGFVVGIVSIATALLTIIFAVFITYLLYALILRFSSEQKIKDIIGYFQIFMTIFFAVGFQVIPRLVDFDKLLTHFRLHWYSYLLPPVWMALTLEAFKQLNFDAIHLIMIACAILVPVFTFWLMIKYVAPAFAKKLGALGNDSVKKNITSAPQKNRNFSDKLSPIVCRSSSEKSGFEIVWEITGRDKNFKIQFYPGLAYMFVFIFIFVFKSGRDIENIWEHLPTTKAFLFFVYLPVLTVASGIGFISFYENYQASWIYQSTPVASPGHIISGSLKALLVKFFIPVFLILFFFSLFIWGMPVINDFVLGFFNNILVFLLIANIGDYYLPFSRQQNSKEQSGRFIQIFLQLFAIGALLGVHYLIIKIDWLIYCFIPLSAVGCYLFFKKIKNIPWFKISF